MGKELKRQLYINRKDFLLALAIPAGMGVFLTGVLVCLGIFTGETENFPPLGGIGFYFGAGLYGLIMAVGCSGVHFNMALKMGAVRRRYLLASAIIIWGTCFALLLLGNLWSFAEKGLAALAGIRLDVVLYVGPHWAALAALAITIIGGWMGALLMRFGKVGFWVIWALWMVLSLGGGQLAGLVGNSARTDPFARGARVVFAFFESLGLSALWALAALALIALAVSAWLLLHKARVQE